MHLRQRGPLICILERVQHIERRHNVERAGWKRRRRHAGARQAYSSHLAADRKACRGQVEPECGSKPAEQREIRAGAAAAIQNPWIRTIGGGVPEEGRDERAEAAKPEMTRLGARGGAQQVLHRADSIVSS